MDNEKKNLGHMSIDPMTGKTVYVKPGDKNPAEKREERKKELISLLRQYVSEHSNGPLKEETDPMVVVCNDAADMLQATVFKDFRFMEEVKLECIVQRRVMKKWLQDTMTEEERGKMQKEMIREAGRDLVMDVLYSGLVDVQSGTDPDTGDWSVNAEMYVGVRNGEDIDAMLEDHRDYDKFHQ